MATHLSTASVPALCSAPEVPMYVTFPMQEVASTGLSAFVHLIFLLLLTHLPPTPEEAAEKSQQEMLAVTFIVYEAHATYGEDLNFTLSGSMATI